jgi:hypothetical protein
MRTVCSGLVIARTAGSCPCRSDFGMQPRIFSADLVEFIIGGVQSLMTDSESSVTTAPILPQISQKSASLFNGTYVSAVD